MYDQNVHPQIHWVHTLLGHTRFIDTAAVALKVTEISDAIYRSAATRREIVF